MSDRTSRNPDMATRIRQYRRARRKFSIKVYVLAAIFLFVSLLHWTLSVTIPALGRFLLSVFYISMLFLFIALVIITAFGLWERLRFKFPINWVLAVAFVECMSLGLMAVFVNYSVLYFYVCFLITAAIVAICVVVGIWMPRDLTLDVVILFVFSIIFFIGSVLFLTLAILANVFYSVFIYAVFVMVIVVMFLMYHAQTIHGTRYGEMRVKDFLLAALIIYGDFVILLTMSIFMMQLFSTGALVTKTIEEDFRRKCLYCDRNVTAYKFIHEDYQK